MGQLHAVGLVHGSSSCIFILGPRFRATREKFSLDGSLESRREGLTEQALCSPAPGAHLCYCKSLAQHKSSAMAEDCAPMRTQARE